MPVDFFFGSEESYVSNLGTYVSKLGTGVSKLGTCVSKLDIKLLAIKKLFLRIENTFSTQYREILVCCKGNSCFVPGVRISNKVGMLKVC